MKQLSVTVFGLLLGSAAMAQTVLQPVQHVYPDSTLAEIQQAIDTGGTVYFERLTKAAKEVKDYNQVASSTPDLPPTTDNPAKGFNIGTNGKDVHIIGMLGVNGERPKINGGTIVFRVGQFAGFGFTGLPVSFRIENLELFNPDMAGPASLYARIGIWVLNALGAEGTVNNCKITITGKEADSGHASNHSVGIWFYLAQPQTGQSFPPPPSGARMNLTNNTVTLIKGHEGLHVNSFWPETGGYVGPRAFLSNNIVTVTNLGGFLNTGTAIILAGNISDSIVTNNIVRGEGRSPGLTPPVETRGIVLTAANAPGVPGASSTAPPDVLVNVTIVGNDFSAFSGDYQLVMQPLASGTMVARNLFGPASAAGVMCSGHDNWLDGNHFYGDYPGWDSSGKGRGLVLFTKTAARNRLTRTRMNHSVNICGQLLEETPGANILPGYDQCQNQ